jgi:hypothetical protein
MAQRSIPSPAQTSVRILACCVLGLVLIAIVFFIWKWPFRRDTVIKELEDERLGKVTIGSLRATYFPHPGCILERVIFQHNPKLGSAPLITIERVRIETSFTRLFTRHLRLVNVEGMHIRIPPLGSEKFETPQRPTVVIDDLVADGTILEAASRVGNPPVKFTFHGFTVSHVGGYGPASFKATLSNAVPPGAITTNGKFGPWNADDVGKTPVSGEYYFGHADLSVFAGISGILSSSGKFDGTVERVAVEGTTNVQLFATNMSSHKVALKTRFQAVVNAKNGDTFLQNIVAGFNKTNIWAQGSVAGHENQRNKTVALEISSKDGRIEDLLRLFSKSPNPPMSGAVSFKAKASLPSGEKPFLEKLELQGDFGIDDGSFTKIDTQQGVNSLSRGALGEKNPQPDNDQLDPQNVLSDLKGHVLLRNGTARFSDLSFSVPGALAEMRGTYNLISEKIDLHGTLKTMAEVSKTTHGIKALMLKVLDPFFKNKPGGYVAPIKITGTYDHPSFALDLGNGDNDKNQTAKKHHLTDQAKH